MARKEKPTHITENEVFPTRLRQIMEERKVSQGTLGDEIGVRRQTVSLYTTGQSKPDTDKLTAIARYFDVSADWLLGISDVETPDADMQAICKITGLTEAAVNCTKLYADAQRFIDADDYNLTVPMRGIQALSLLLESRHGILDELAIYFFTDLNEYKDAVFELSVPTGYDDDGNILDEKRVAIPHWFTNKNLQAMQMLKIQQCLFSINEELDENGINNSPVH